VCVIKDKEHSFARPKDTRYDIQKRKSALLAFKEEDHDNDTIAVLVVVVSPRLLE
jgi:hypothetical protein